MRVISSGAVGFWLGRTARPVMAGPFGNDYLKMIPADKKFDPAWVQSLYVRGNRQTYTGDDLTYIGMPVASTSA